MNLLFNLDKNIIKYHVYLEMLSVINEIINYNIIKGLIKYELIDIKLSNEDEHYYNQLHNTINYVSN